jgi:Domain of unknown function (DUF222)
LVACTDAHSADQRRADALVDVFTRVLGDPSLPEAYGQRPAINVTVSLSTLLGCDDHPAQLDGYGPITAALARRLAADQSGTWRRLVTDNTGHLLDYGRKPTGHPPTSPTTSSPGTTCTFPDADDQPDSATSSTTRPGVAAARQPAQTSARYANATTTPKHDAGWQVHRRPDGTSAWTSPTGHRYGVRPP